MAVKIMLKRALGGVARLRPAPARRKLILLYHSIGERPWATPQADFAAQMRWLSHTARVVSLPQLLDGDFDDPWQAAITFDDGYASLRDKALPILRDLGAVASVFITTGCIAERARTPSDPKLGHYPDETFLSWRDVEDLAAAGWTIGSHGVDHVDLTAASTATDAQLLASRRAIETRINPAKLYFAYPWGRHDFAARRAVQGAGYQCALSCEHAPLEAGFDPWAAPRINIQRDYSLNDFAAAVAGDWDYLGWAQRLWGGK